MIKPSRLLGIAGFQHSQVGFSTHGDKENQQIARNDLLLQLFTLIRLVED